MKTEAARSHGEAMALVSTPTTKIIENTPVESVQCEEDTYDDSSTDENSVKYRHVFKDAKALWGKPLEEPKKVDWPKWEAVAREEDFIAHPTVKVFFKLERDFERTMRVVGHQKYRWMDEIGLEPSVYPAEDGLVGGRLPKDERKLEYWHQKHQIKFDYLQAKEELKSKKRQASIEAKGKGFGGRMTKKVARSKEASFFAKNNLTIRGNVFKLTHKTCPKNIYEIMPRYGYRKGAHIGVRVTQFTLTTILAALGYALMPVSFGISKIVTDHTRTLITLSGEVITHKIAGADNGKCLVHAGLRGVQLEVPRLIPIAGDVVNIGEGVAFGTAALGIVSTTIADMLLAHFSGRYTSTINLDDLGDSRCLEELNSRIDYLSQFLLPHGQYLLLKETDIDQRKKIKKVLKENFKTLRDLEKKKINSLNYYRLALAAEKIPESHREKIRRDCEVAMLDMRVNTHRVVKQCLATLIAQDESLQRKDDIHMVEFDAPQMDDDASFSDMTHASLEESIG